MPASTIIFHPARGFALCYATSFQGAVPGVPSPEHAAAVYCGLCGLHGVIPDPGHELEFLPPGTESAPDGRGFILKFPPARLAVSG